MISEDIYGKISQRISLLTEKENLEMIQQQSFKDKRILPY